MKLPPHINLTIEHQPHAANYEPLETWIENYLSLAEARGESHDEAILPSDLAAIRATGEVWEMSWCPDSPVGSCCVVAATLERVLELAARSPVGLEPRGDRELEPATGAAATGRTSSGLVGRTVMCKVKRGEVEAEEQCEIVGCQAAGYSGSWHVLVATHDGTLLEVGTGRLRLVACPDSGTYR